jgi:hypothetical protein
MAANGLRQWRVKNDAPILTESPRREKFAACYDPATVVTPVPVAACRYRWRVHACDVGVVHAAYRVLRLARVDGVVLARRGGMSRGVRPLSGYL